ncbi:MAG: response regulator [Anaerolineales bacterium]
MKSVIVVDDELIMREFFENVFPWETIGMRLVDTAADGQFALEKCKALEPDLVLIDIVMPGMGGLELLEHLRTNIPYTQCVVLTSHEDFQYIQSALKLGALDYIVKSKTTPDEMVVKLKEINSKIDLIQRKPSLVTVKREWLVRLLTGGVSDNNELEEKLNRLHFSISDGRTQVLIIELDYPYQSVEFESYQEYDYLFPMIKEKIEYTIKDLNSIIWTPIPPVFFALVESSTDPQKSNKENELSRVFRVLQNEAMNQFSLIGGLSNQHSSLLAAPLAFKEAKQALESRFYLNLQLIPFRANWNPLPQELYAHLDKLAVYTKPQHQSQYSFINGILHNIIDLCEKYWIEPNETKLLVAGFLHQIIQKLTIDISTWDMSLWPIQIASINRSGDLINWAHRIIERLLASAEYPTVRPEIKKILNEIQMNISAELDLNWASNLVSLHPNYFSKIFRKETGETFSGYLNRVRIERATKYLQEGVWSNQQIAEMVGLPDYRTFFNVFKRIVGKSPTDFKNSIPDKILRL